MLMEEIIETFVGDVIYHDFYLGNGSNWRYTYKNSEVRLYRGRKLYCVLYIGDDNSIQLDKNMCEYDSWFSDLIMEYFNI